MNRIEKIVLRAAGLGEDNPLPDFRKAIYIREGEFIVDDSVLDGEKENWFGKGNAANVLPYKMQDGYNRKKEEKEHTAVVLENEYLKAVFLPCYGGRLWSLYDKKAKRDLLYTNSVVQPCNLAVRNAWLSGGVEFNVGVWGHTPLTCSPMFTELVGDNAVRFYEYERIRGIAYGFTACLPENSRTLYIRPRIENTSDEPIYTYWWSNIAFPETENTRVIVPADEAIKVAYEETYYHVYKTPVPVVDGVDVSFSKKCPSAGDYFWKIPKDVDKWIMAVDKNGDGLLQYSTKLLKGRKLFVWGATDGSSNWNAFLSEEGQRYLEIQAGLLHTQIEHKPIPAHTVWEWTEGYTYVNGANKAFYGDWKKAQQEGWAQIAKYFENGGVAFDHLADLDMSGEIKPVCNGSGFGALENVARKAQGKKPISEVYAFPNVDDESTEDYTHLLEKGYIPYRDVNQTPKAYMSGEFFNELLKKSLETQEGKHWYTYLLLGVNEYTRKNYAAAKEAFENSLKEEPSMWAYRNLAMIEWFDKRNKDVVLDFMAKAYTTEKGKTNRSFIVEYAKTLLDFDENQAWVDVYERLPENLKKDGRALSYYATALVALDREEEAIAIVSVGLEVCDVREGEISLSNLWISAYAKRIAKNEGISFEEAKEKAEDIYPVPHEIDFRMKAK